MTAIERTFGAVSPRRAYYPGASERLGRLTSARSNVLSIGTAKPDELPWTMMAGLDATDPREPAFETEPFCPILSETEVGSDDPIEFLERAVDFANNRLWGTLSAQLVVHPSLFRNPTVAAAIERAIGRLRYGSVNLNSWSGITFAFGTLPWGAYPGSSASNIQSGTGWVHNTSMLEGVQKVVLRHPLTIVPKPATFPGHRTAHTLMRRVTFQEEHGRWGKVPGVIASAMRG
jgi:aldehyde dehydrogenase (NAD(P)+)